MRPFLILAALLAPLGALAGGAPEYRVGMGDVLRVQVYEEPDLTREIPIPANCRLQMALIQPVEACGRTVEEIADEVMGRLANGYIHNPVVMVEVAKYGSQKVEVTGAVDHPGVQLLEGPTTLSQAITAAGGAIDDSVVSVEVVHADGSSEIFRLSNLRRDGEPIYVNGGDKVVLKQGDRVGVLGAVEKPGEVPFREGMTVLQALAAAGDISEYGSDRRAFILRSDGEKVPVNIARIREGRDADVVLDPGDKLYIRRSIF